MIMLNKEIVKYAGYFKGVAIRCAQSGVDRR
jgi:hypothetical protein